MKIHEYQAKALLAKYGVPVPKGKSASKSAVPLSEWLDGQKNSGRKS